MLAAFLIVFPALFSIVNPVAGAFIFREATAGRTHAERVRLARRVGIYSLLVMLVALWTGSYALAVFGISIAALRIAGGIVVALFAWELLGTPHRREHDEQQQAKDVESTDDVAFFPLTLPITTGPGTIAVSVALGAGHPTISKGPEWVLFHAGMGVAALTMAIVIALLYAYADRLSLLLGRTGSRTVTRLSAFLLFCIGVQVLLTGVSEAVVPWLAARP